jgi:hypothetical protein
MLSRSCERGRNLGKAAPDAACCAHTKRMMERVRDERYSRRVLRGDRADERPLRFVLRGRPFEIAELDGGWYSPDASYFRVRAEDGNYYVLRHDEVQDLWTLDGFRAMR